MIAPFRERYERALGDARLRGNLLTFQRAWRETRDAAFRRLAERGASVGATEASFEEARARLIAAKERVLADPWTWQATFRRNAEAAGLQVHEAATAEAARETIRRLLQERGVRLLAKGKSMVAEEIFLNHHLEEAGLKVVETDLGEWIVQLARETPSHMVMPAIHKSRQQVGQLFEEQVGTRPVSHEDVKAQVDFARDELRQVFLTADAGMIGANALIAETGSAMLITNEGNGDLVSTLPEVLIVIAGWEKLLPTMADAAAQLRLLARSATAQEITSYTSFLTGTESNGTPREVHLVLLDNGRSEMHARPAFRDALRCIRCAACADVCPPYQVVGGHVFGHVYSGAIGLVNTPFHHGLDAVAGPQSLCVSCNACATVCPVGIPLPAQILDVRADLVARRGLPLVMRAGLFVWRRAWLFNLAMRAVQVAQRPFRHGRFLRLPLPADWKWRTPPALAEPTAWEALHRASSAGACQDTLGSAQAPVLEVRQGTSPCTTSDLEPPGPVKQSIGLRARDGRRALVFDAAASGPWSQSKAKGLTVAYFVQCLTDRFAPEQAEAAIRVLRACGVRVVVPPGQHCCGLPALDAGDRATARVMARQTIEALEAVQADYVVSAAASCAVAIMHDYGRLLGDEPPWRERAERLASRTLDLLSFLVRVADPPALPSNESRNESRPAQATFHGFCQSTNVLGIGGAGAELLRRVGVAAATPADSDVCCGFGGSTSLLHPRVSRGIAERKLTCLRETGASVVATDNPGCLLHLRGAAHAAGDRFSIRHVAELLAERVDPPGTRG